MQELIFDSEQLTYCPMNGKAKPEECFGCNYCKVSGDDLIARCIYENVFVNKPLEVDAFGIDIETLAEAATGQFTRFTVALAGYAVVEEVIKNLALDDKKRFEEYQEQNDPCR